MISPCGAHSGVGVTRDDGGKTTDAHSGVGVTRDDGRDGRAHSGVRVTRDDEGNGGRADGGSKNGYLGLFGLSAE